MWIRDICKVCSFQWLCVGSEAPFELRIMSGVPLEMVPLPEVSVDECLHAP